MKKNKLLIFTFLSFFAISFYGCTEDDDPDGLINFVDETIDLTTDDLSPIEINFSIDPPAPKDSEFTVSITGAEAGTVFTTSPELSGNEVTIPVSSGATSASMTITPDEDAIGFDDIVLMMEIVSTGDGLATGLTTESTVNIANAIDTGEELPFMEDFDVCGEEGSGELPPEGWEEIVVQQNAENSSVWTCIPEFFGSVGIQVNSFVADSDDETSSEVWMVSPRINLIDATSPKLSFDVDRRFPGTGDFPEDLYDIMISTDYTGLNFETANWERFEEGFDAMTANDPEEDDMANTGDLDLSAYAGQVISIGFVYRAGGPGSFDATILRIGNVSVSE
ncbi:MAG: choice-of-anchor J domain-containing protein [Bacteroidota bacterium]